MPAKPSRDAGETFTLDLCRQITFSLDGGAKTVRVYYTTSNGVATDRLTAQDSVTPQQIADQIVLWTRDAWVTYRGYGFNPPMGRSDMNVHVFDMRAGLAGWCCTPDNYEIDVPSILPAFRTTGDRRNAEQIVYHEMWHAAEWSPSFGCWVNEGTASNMTDHVNLGLDNYTNNDFIGRARGYLGFGTETSLTDHCYDGALWWKYYMEQTTALTTEPNRGVDRMLDFWRDAGSTDFTRMDNVIRNRTPGRTLESVWIDFAVANYAKELTGAGVTTRHIYQDERQSSAPDYPAVRLTKNLALNNGAVVGPELTDIAAWSAQYYQFTPAASLPFINLEVRQDSNRRLGYVLLLIRGNDIVQETRVVGRDFVQSFANNNYSQVVLIVVGLNQYANFRYAVNATAPTLRIVDPLNARKALAGRPDAPDKILVKVEVLNPAGAGTPIAGIDPNVFTITVGSQVVQPAQRISAAYVQGQYWLLVRAPNQSATGDYNLRVDYASLTDTENLAVRYQTRNDTDNMIVIDRSGSMGFFGGTPMQAAKDAGRIYVDSFRVGDKVGVVGFNDVATVPPDLTLRDWQTATSRIDAQNAINALTPAGGTCIGCGLQEGLNQLAGSGLASHDWAIIVLSDGQENASPKIADFMTTYNARRNGGQQVPRIHTVALGPDADRARLEKLASDTGGSFHFASIPAGSAGVAAIDAVQLTNSLAEIYRTVGETVARQQQVYAETSTLQFGQTISHTIPIEKGVSEAVFVLKWDFGFLGANLDFRDPNGNPAPSPTLMDGLHYVWRIPTPLDGDWTLTLDFEDACEFCASEVLVEAAVTSDLTFDVYLGLAVQDRLVGRPMPILASLADSAPIPGATVQATVIAPTGAFYLLTLFDDGLHGDGAAGDGFYGNTFYNTHAWGSYDLIVRATGTSANTGPFARRLRASFNMLQTRILDDPNFDPNFDPANPGNPNGPVVDEDGDGLPTWWEEEYGLDPTTPNQTEDPDHDGLPNSEEYDKGTNPLDSDTDGGGQNDGSESTSGADPLDPSDDQTLCPLVFYAESVIHDRDEHINAKAAVLYYDVHPDHDNVFIWRSQNPAGPPEVLAGNTPATGVYSDTTVILGQTYYYWLSAYDLEGHASCILGPAEVTPSEDPIEPEGVVMINDGAKSTDKAAVVLSLNASADTTQMQISNSLSFSDTVAADVDAGWEPYATTKQWTLEPQGGVGSVFVLFRDAAGNVSEPESDSIEFAEAGKLYLPRVDR